MHLFIVPARRDGWLSSLYDDDPPHVLKTGVRWHHSLQWHFIVLRDT